MAEIRDVAIVDEVRWDRPLVDRIGAALRFVRMGGGALGVLVFGALTLVMAGVLRLAVLARRDEIEIMRLVGAGPDMVRGPFLLAGAFQGASGAVAALELLEASRMAALARGAEIGPLVATSKTAITISGVCAVFAESEVINHLSLGTAPADIMQGAVESLTSRSIQLMKRAGPEPEFPLIGGILRFERMVDVVRAELKAEVNVPAGDLVQFVAALGAAYLGQRRMEKVAAA